MRDDVVRGGLEKPTIPEELKPAPKPAKQPENPKKTNKKLVAKKPNKLQVFIKKNKLPIFIIVGVVILALIGLGIYFAVNKNNQKPKLSGIAADYEKRLPELKKDADEKPKDPEARKKYAIALYATGDKKSAEKQYEEVVKLNDKDSVAYNNLGNVYRDNKETDKAIEAYKKSIEINKTAINPYVNLANIQLYSKNDADAAIETYRQALKALPDNSQIEILLGVAYEQKGDKESAKNTYQNILSREEDNAAAKAGVERLK